MTTKHKWANEIHAWADGAQIQYFDRFDKAWRDIVGNGPTWGECNEYRVKPEPEAEWKQKLRQAAREGKTVQININGEPNGWHDCAINDSPDTYSFHPRLQVFDYRVIEPKVTRWLWVHKTELGWYQSLKYLTEAEAEDQLKNRELYKMEHTRMEFDK